MDRQEVKRFVADALRAAGATDVFVSPTMMGEVTPTGQLHFEAQVYFRLPKPKQLPPPPAPPNNAT
jgi:hypothetical protein